MKTYIRKATVQINNAMGKSYLKIAIKNCLFGALLGFLLIFIGTGGTLTVSHGETTINCGFASIIYGGMLGFFVDKL